MRSFILLSLISISFNAQGLLCSKVLYNQTVSSIENSFRQSNLVRFFDGVVEQSIPKGEFQKERSYTVVIYNNQITLGHNIGNRSPQNINSRTRSHVTLNSYINHPAPGLYLHDAGAVQFHRDGSVSVSGYHMLQDSTEAVDNIIAYLNKIHPGLQIHSTPGKLKEILPQKR